MTITENPPEVQDATEAAAAAAAGEIGYFQDRGTGLGRHDGPS